MQQCIECGNSFYRNQLTEGFCHKCLINLKQEDKPVFCIECGKKFDADKLHDGFCEKCIIKLQEIESSLLSLVQDRVLKDEDPKKIVFVQNSIMAKKNLCIECGENFLIDELNDGFCQNCLIKLKLEKNVESSKKKIEDKEKKKKENSTFRKETLLKNISMDKINNITKYIFIVLFIVALLVYIISKTEEDHWKYSDDTVIDTHTGLIWQDNMDAKVKMIGWSEALHYCKKLSLSGYSDWRMPTEKELSSIIEEEKSYFAQSENKKNIVQEFQYIAPSSYWTNKTWNGYASIIYFNESLLGEVTSASLLYINHQPMERHYIRCVSNGKRINNQKKNRSDKVTQAEIKQYKEKQKDMLHKKMNKKINDKSIENLYKEGKIKENTPKGIARSFMEYDYTQLMHSAMAVAIDGNKKWVSGISTARSTQKEAKKQAIEVCENRRQEYSINQKCEIFAINGELVHKSSKKLLNSRKETQLKNEKMKSHTLSSDPEEALISKIFSEKKSEASPSKEEIVYRGIKYATVVSPYTKRVWLDRNLGASRRCKSIDDSKCFGDYYQWGRNADGHEKENSQTIENLSANVNHVEHDKFISLINSENYDWANVDDSGEERIRNWRKVDGTSLCPAGFRVPTLSEWKAELLDPISGKVKYVPELFDSFLKIPIANYRSYQGPMENEGKAGGFWTSSATNEGSSFVYYAIRNGVKWRNDGARAAGRSVRCIKDIDNKEIKGNNTISEKKIKSPKELYKKCSACHGTDGSKTALGKSKPIAGKPINILLTELKGYKEGTISKYQMGGVMKGQVASMSDDELERLAVYIHQLIPKKQIPIKRRMIKKSSKEYTKELITAINNENTSKVKILLQKGVNPNSLSTPNIVPLVCSTVNSEILIALLDHGADPNTKCYTNEKHSLPISFVSIQNGDKKLLKKLIEKGADLEVVDEYGQNLLEFSADNSEILEILKRHMPLILLNKFMKNRDILDIKTKTKEETFTACVTNTEHIRVCTESTIVYPQILNNDQSSSMKNIKTALNKVIKAYQDAAKPDKEMFSNREYSATIKVKDISSEKVTINTVGSIIGDRVSTFDNMYIFSTKTGEKIGGEYLYEPKIESQKRGTNSTSSIESVKVKCSYILNKWNNALNDYDISTLSLLYAENLIYYGKKRTKTYCLNDKEKALEKYPKFTQNISNIDQEKVSNNIYKVTFIKQSRSKPSAKKRTFSGYLLVDIKKNKIIEEGDKTTDKNIGRVSSAIKKTDVSSSINEHFSNQYLKAKIVSNTKGNYVYFQVDVTNIYGSGKGGISISFPGLNPSDSILGKGKYGFRSLSIYNSHQLVWNREYRKKVDAQYKLLEGWSEQWRKGKVKAIGFKLPKSVAAKTKINIRAVLITDKQEHILPEYGEKDQQGYPVKSYRWSNNSISLSDASSSLQSKKLGKVTHIPSDDTLNVRAAPGIYDQKIGELPPNGYNIEILRYSNNRKWINIRYQHYGNVLEGWVYGKYISVQSKRRSDDDALSYAQKKKLLRVLENYPNDYPLKSTLLKQLHDIIHGTIEYFITVDGYQCKSLNNNRYQCNLIISGFAKEDSEEISWSTVVKFHAIKKQNVLTISKVDSVMLYD